MNEQPQRPSNLDKSGFHPVPSSSGKGRITPPPSAPLSPTEHSLRLVDQLLVKTKEGKLPWTTGFEDGQFKTVLPDGELAFVIQVKGEVRKFMMLDDHQEVILEKAVTRDDAHLDNIQSQHAWVERLYEGIGELQDLARCHALQVNEKLTKAEKLLAAI